MDCASEDQRTQSEKTRFENTKGNSKDKLAYIYDQAHLRIPANLFINQAPVLCMKLIS
jgi:hypothetical protein